MSISDNNPTVQYARGKFYYEYLNGSLSIMPVIQGEDGKPAGKDHTVSVRRDFSSEMKRGPYSFDANYHFSEYDTFDKFYMATEISSKIGGILSPSLTYAVQSELKYMLMELAETVDGVAIIDTSPSHATHCCEVHGCKYGLNCSCPVSVKVEQQKYLCERCHNAQNNPERIIRLQAEYDKVQAIKARIA